MTYNIKVFYKEYYVKCQDDSEGLAIADVWHAALSDTHAIITLYCPPDIREHIGALYVRVTVQTMTLARAQVDEIINQIELIDRIKYGNQYMKIFWIHE